MEIQTIFMGWGEAVLANKPAGYRRIFYCAKMTGIC